MIYNILRKLRLCGYTATLCIVKRTGTLSFIIGSFSDMELLELSHKLEAMMERFGGELEIAVHPRPHRQEEEHIVVYFSSTWQMHFQESSLREKLRIFKKVIELWELEVLYGIGDGVPA